MRLPILTVVGLIAPSYANVDVAANANAKNELDLPPRRKLRGFHQQQEQQPVDESLLESFTRHVVVKCKPNSEQACRKEILSLIFEDRNSRSLSEGERVGIEQELTGSDYFGISISEERLSQLRDQVDVEDIEEDVERTIFDEFESYEFDDTDSGDLSEDDEDTWSADEIRTQSAPDNQSTPSDQTIPHGIRQIEAHHVWNRWTNPSKGKGTKICIMDTGYRPHVDIDPNRVRGTDLLDAHEKAGWNTDEVGHGTFIAGIIAASDNKIGTVGVAPEAGLFVTRVTTHKKNSVRFSAIAESLLACKKAGVDVISISLGGTRPSQFEKDFFDDLLFKHGIVTVAAAGNTGGGNNEVVYPAAHPNVISVSALDGSYNIAPFSTRNMFVDVAAPGVHVRSLDKDGDGYKYNQGTSFAAPYVAGAIALLKSSNLGVSVLEIRDAIFDSAIDFGPRGRDDSFGRGMINVLEAHKILLDKKFEKERGRSGVFARQGCSGAEVEIQALPDSFAYADRTRILLSNDNIRVMNKRLLNNQPFEYKHCAGGCNTFQLVDESPDSGHITVKHAGKVVYDLQGYFSGHSYAVAFGSQCPKCVNLSMEIKGDSKSGSDDHNTRYKLVDMNTNKLIWSREGLEPNKMYSESACLSTSHDSCYQLIMDDDGSNGTEELRVKYNGLTVYMPYKGNFGQWRDLRFGAGCA